MAIFDIKSIKNNKDTNAVIGDNNVTLFSQQLLEVKETHITSESNDWQQVIEQIAAMQKVISQVPDEHEEVRDQQLVPTLSKAKAEAAKLEQEPSSNKSRFLDSFKAFLDVANSVADVGGKIAPYVVTIAKLIGVPLA
jgi:hypothetical protein